MVSSGALAFGYPGPADQGRRLRTMLTAYRQAGGQALDRLGDERGRRLGLRLQRCHTRLNGLDRGERLARGLAPSIRAAGWLTHGSCESSRLRVIAVTSSS